ncbi:MAG: DUF4233 domain-containing protein [Jiangellaceae bacterium]
MNRIAVTILSIEAIVVLLAVPVALNVSDVSSGIAWLSGGAVAAACVVGAATVRRGRVGYLIGSLAQLAAIAMGFLVTLMFVLGGIFALMWFLLLRIGPDVERSKVARSG